MKTVIVSIPVLVDDAIGIAKTCDDYLICSIKLAVGKLAAGELRELAMQKLADEIARFYQPASVELRAEVAAQARQWLHDTDDWHNCYSSRSAAMLWGGPTCVKSNERVQDKCCKNCKYYRKTKHEYDEEWG